jgi:hypothetical protein
VTFVKHLLGVLAVTGVVLTGLGWYFLDQVGDPVRPVTVTELPADQEQLIAAVAIVAPPLAIDKAGTIELLRQSCADLTLSEQEIKNHFIERFSTGEYTMTKAEAIIVSTKLRRSGLCGS